MKQLQDLSPEAQRVVLTIRGSFQGTVESRSNLLTEVIEILTEELKEMERFL